MDSTKQNEPAPIKARTTMDRKSEREFVVTRTVNGPARLVFKAWSTPELFKQWWLPKSFGISIISYEADIRAGGTYRLVMAHPVSGQPMAFFGTYTEVTPPSRLVWTNDESDDGAVTTVTFEPKGDATLVVVHELYPTKAALDEAIASQSTTGWGEQFEQLDALLGSLDANVG